MDRASVILRPSDNPYFPGFDEDISTVRNVARKTFETLELNVKTCVKIAKLVEAITSEQGTGLRLWTRSNSDLSLQRFKDDIESLQRKEDARLAMMRIALKNGFQIAGESCTRLGMVLQDSFQWADSIDKPPGPAMCNLQTIDRRLREEIADSLKCHLMQKIRPDYTRLQEIASPLCQEALQMGDIIEHEFIMLRATCAQSVNHTNETVDGSWGEQQQTTSWGINPSINYPELRSPDDPRLLEEGRIGEILGERAIAMGSERAATNLSGTTICN